MKLIRIFISSPGDVREERDRARQVVESLRHRYAGSLNLRPLLWEDLPLQPDMSFQQGIDEILSERGVEVAVFILWSRLGTPTGPLVVKGDGEPYRSGTEREYDLMMAARDQSRTEEGNPRPDILVYTRSDEASFEERLRGKPTEEKEALIAQKKLVESFITEQFQDAETGTNIGAYLGFDRPVTFQQRLRTHLEDLLDPIAGVDVANPVWDMEKLGVPFLGLAAYQFEHAAVFFGREDEIVSARQALRSRALEGCAFLMISGASGSGKSSLARAGLLPAIVENEIDEVVESWLHVEFMPGELGKDLINGLAERVAQVLPSLRENQSEFTDFRTLLRENPEIAWRQIMRKSLGEKERLIILVDQLEELFTTPCLDDADRASLCMVLEVLASTGSVWIVVTMRSDFSHLCQSIPPLFRLTQQGEMGILPPASDSIARVIADPARLAGLFYEKRDDGVSLGDVLLREATEHRELLPFLSHILRRLAEERTGQGEITFAAYEQKLGGAGGKLRQALASYAEEIFQNLPPDSQAKLPEIWPKLVTLGGEDHSQALRKYASLSELTRDPHREVLVNRFVDARLFIASGDMGTDQAVLTVSHETLLHAWDRARDWIETNRQYLQMRATVERYQDLWEKSAPNEPARRDRSLLLPRGLPINQARELLKNQDSISIDGVREYIELSIRRDFWKRLRGIGLLIGVSVLAMAIGITALIAYFEGFAPFSKEEKALEKYQRDVYEREAKMPRIPPPLKDPDQASRPKHLYQNRLGMELIWCWPGSFVMGSREDEPGKVAPEKRIAGESPHQVNLTRGFWMARHEVTQDQWKKLMAHNQSPFFWNKNYPLEGVSWKGAMKFCRHLTELEKSHGSIPEGWEYTLPTEAQWEYACRAGSSAPFSGPSLDELGWYLNNSFLHPHPVGTKQPNPWGFHDMHGNVWEWCQDWVGEYQVGEDVVNDPTGPKNGHFRVDRGGGWFGWAGRCRSAARDGWHPDNSHPFNMIGFRPVLQLSTE